MLVLTRKVGEGIAIGEDIKIIVMQIKGKQVRLGIKASPSTVVHREEVFKRIQEENKRASLSPVEGLTEISRLLQGGDAEQSKPVVRSAKGHSTKAS